MSSADAIAFLHLSDVQFGKYHRFDPGELCGRIGEDVKALMDAGSLRPELVFLTGDLTEWALPSEFEQVEAFVRGLASRLDLALDRFVIIPGNHDINRKKCEAYFNDCEGDERKPRLPYWPKLEPYANSFVRLYAGTAFHFVEKEPWTWFEWSDLPVVVAGMNSALADSHRAEDHYGFLGEEQLRFFADKLAAARSEGKLRIVAVHHDVMHAQGVDNVTEQDARDFKRIVGPGPNLVLHGHTHREDLEWLGQTQPVLCIGSAGVKPAERPPEVPNQYRWFVARRTGLTYRTRSWVPDQKRWIDDPRADRRGESGVVDVRVAFDDVDAAFGDSPRASTGGRKDGVPSEVERAVAAYRHHVARMDGTHAPFDLLTFGEDDGAKALELKDLFVVPAVTRAISVGDAPNAEAGRATGIAPSIATQMEAAAARILMRRTPKTADELLAPTFARWSLVLGGPGSGKTTLTRWMQWKIAATPGSLETDPNAVAIRIELGRFMERARSAGTQSYDFFDDVARSLRDQHVAVRAEDLRALAAAGRVVWLLDGLDEVTIADERRDCIRRIVGLASASSGRGTVTSRQMIANDATREVARAGFAAYELAPLSNEQVKSLIDKWHDASFGRDVEKGRRRKERLVRALADNPSLADLAKTPLLLTLLCLLNRGADLPRRRHAVYERAIEQMAHQWEANKHLSDEEASTFDLDDKLAFLRDLAWKMTDLPGGLGNIVRETDLEEFATRFVSRRFNEPESAARRKAIQLVRRLRDRDGVLASFGGDAFGFTHRAFLEYLVAKAMVTRFQSHEWNEARLGAAFAEHWADEDWTEPLTVVCGILDKDRPELIVSVLQAVARDLELDPWTLERFTSFGILCLAEAAHPEQEPIGALARRLTLEAAQQRNERAITALRRAGSRWPDAAWLRAKALDESISTDDLHWAARAALATWGSGERLDVVEFASKRLPARHVTGLITTVDELGAWAPLELGRLGLIRRGADASVTAAIETVLAQNGDEGAAGSLRTRNAAMGADIIAQALFGFATGEDRPEVFEALTGLLKKNVILARLTFQLFSDKGVDGASYRATILEFLQSPEPEVRSAAEREGVRLGIVEAVEAIASRLRAATEFSEVARECDLMMSAAHGSELGRARLHDLVADERVAPDIRAELLCGLVGLDDSRSLKTLRELGSSSPNLSIRVRAASCLGDSDAWGDEGARILLELARTAPGHAVRMDAVNELVDWEVDDVLREGLEEIARGDDHAVGAEALLILAEQSGVHGTRAVNALTRMAETDEDPNVRLRAAEWLSQHGGAHEAMAQRALRELSATSTNEGVQLRAATRIADGATLATLAETAAEERHRDNARAALDVLRFKTDLLRIGKPRRGRVSFAGVPVGTIEETRTGTKFTYDPAWVEHDGAVAIAPTLPVRATPFETDGLHPFFDNLLPEGFLDDAAVRAAHVHAHDRFGLLLHVGADVVGAVEVVPYEEDAA